MIARLAGSFTAPAYAGATPEQIAELHTLLRRLFQLSDDATIEDMNRALIAFEQGELALNALSAELPMDAAMRSKIQRLCGISDASYRKYAA